ncbi:MAG: ABC transporter permease [Deltaproteobacteria bacterium]|nr:ABC transporter permease [Deltaproteobacteria bacterium]
MTTRRPALDRVGAWLAGVIGAALVVLLVGTVVFFAFRLLPGDPTALVLGDQAGEAERAALRAQLHLDEPLARQYGRFLGSLAHGQVGPSLRRPDVDAATLVLDALPATALLAASSVALGATLGIALALCSVALRRRVAGRVADRLIALGASVPLLAFAPAATWVLAVRLRWVPLPADPDAGARGLLYAAALLSLPLGAAVGRIARASLEVAAQSPFLQVARAKGLGSLRVWLVHALPTCVGPIVTVVAAQLGALLGGAVVLERLLERRGLGTVVAEALAARDLPVLEAAVIVAAALFVVVQAAGTRVHAALDPRARA